MGTQTQLQQLPRKRGFTIDELLSDSARSCDTKLRKAQMTESTDAAKMRPADCGACAMHDADTALKMRRLAALGFALDNLPLPPDGDHSNAVYNLAERCEYDKAWTAVGAPLPVCDWPAPTQQLPAPPLLPVPNASREHFAQVAPPLAWLYEHAAVQQSLCFAGSPYYLGLPSSHIRKPKRVRTAFSPAQLMRMEAAFEKNAYIVGQERKELATSLNLSETQVKVWFQNRRTKKKRVDSGDECSTSNGDGDGDGDGDGTRRDSHDDDDSCSDANEQASEISVGSEILK